MEVTQFTYFQQVGGLDCTPTTGEITYGLERLAMYLQDVQSVYDLVWTEGANGRRVLYRDVFHQNEVEQSTYNFEHSSAQMLFAHFNDYEAEAKRLMDVPLALPAYEATLKAAHTFNMLDARGAISVTATRRLHRPHPQPVARRRPGLLRLPRAAGLSHAGSRPGRRGDCINDDEHPPLLVELLTEELPPGPAEAGPGLRRRRARHAGAPWPAGRWLHDRGLCHAAPPGGAPVGRAGPGP